MISINHATYVISIPKADTTFVETNATTGYEVRSYDEYAFMRELADYLDSEAGVALPSAFTHATAVTISGVIYARALSILSPFTITFENGTYQVKLVGGMNNNILDVLNPNSVSVIPANSAGLQTVVSGSGVTAGDKSDIVAGVWSAVSRSLTANPGIAAADVRAELAAELAAIVEVWRRHGLDIAAPLTQTPTNMTVGDIDLAIIGDPDVSVTVTRQP